MRLLHLSVIAALGVGCATPKPPPKWTHGLPVTVFASESLSRCQRAAVYAGAEWFRVYTGTEVFHVLVGDTPSPMLGTVHVVPGSMGVAEGKAQIRSDDGQIHSATIWLRGCSVRAAAHELGHALGLLHSEDKRGLMYIVNHESSWQLDPYAIKDALASR
jgi:hypothetical protein